MAVRLISVGDNFGHDPVRPGCPFKVTSLYKGYQLKYSLGLTADEKKLLFLQEIFITFLKK